MTSLKAKDTVWLPNNFQSSEHILLRIYGYSYGYLDCKTRPTKINIHGNGLGFNASQTTCLIFANVVPENDNHWNLLLLLFDIVNIVFSPNISEGMTVYLRSLIAEHHTLFKQIYPTLIDWSASPCLSRSRNWPYVHC